MILSFKEQFVPKILKGTKNTTFREDRPRRWKHGMKIHFWKDNPRNITKKPYQFAIGTVKNVYPVEINTALNFIIINGVTYDKQHILNKIAENDGFKDWEDMKTFFPFGHWKGVVIRWTDFEQVGIGVSTGS